MPPDLAPSAYGVAIIENTLYFKGKWTTAFDPSQTDTGVFVLPQAGIPIGPFIAGVTLQDLTHWSAGLQPAAGSIALPRFSAQYSQNLVPALTSLGMGVAFLPNVADFNALAPNAYVSAVFHSTVVEVDESGTTAAAATAIPITTPVAPNLPAAHEVLQGPVAHQPVSRLHV